MYLTGYHGTSKEYAENILNNQRFLPSIGEKQWLGQGIYFYPDFQDALDWAKKYHFNNEAVIHALIYVDDDEIIDFDTSNGKKLFHDIVWLMGKQLNLSKTQIQKNQCIVCNAIWATNKKIKVLKAHFGKEQTLFRTLIDYRKQRLEFCVRDNSVIQGICEVPLKNNTNNLISVHKKEMKIK